MTLRLRCPYADCSDPFAAEPQDELLACPRCRRLAARCPHGGVPRCPTLNQPLAAFCRMCGKSLPDGWAQGQWRLDLARQVNRSNHNGAARLRLRLSADGERVFRFPDLGAFEHWHGAWPLPLQEAAGRLWISAPDTSILRVDPLRPLGAGAVVSTPPLWPKVGQLQVRCQASGPWLVLWADRGIKVLSLLGPDDGGRAALTPTTLWEPRPNEQLAAEPVVLRAWEGSRQRRFVAWVSQQADALQLWVAPLALDAVPGKAKYFFNLPEVPVRPPALGQRAADVSLTAALFGTEEQLLLCTNRDLFRIALIFSNAGPKMRRPQKLLSRPHFVLNHQELSGLVYLPNLSSRPGEPPGGTLFVAHRAEERAARCVLEVVALTRDRVVESFPCGNPDCYPLDAVTTHGEPGALCRSGGQLVRTDVNGTQIPVHTEERLAGTSRVQVYQDVAVCTGFEQTEGPRQRFFRLVDLRERSLVLNGLHVAPTLEAHPLMLGSYLFQVEREGEQLWLTRRRLEAG